MDWPTTCTVQLLLPLLQHFPESFLLPDVSSKDWSYSISHICMDWPNTCTVQFSCFHLNIFLKVHSQPCFFFNLLNWYNPQKLSAELLFFFITGLFVQRLKLLNLAHFYELAKWNGVMCPCYVDKGQATFNYPAAPLALKLCGLWLHGRQSNSLGMQPTWRRPVPTSAFIV